MEEQDWIFTFGYEHRHPVTGESLDGCFVRVPAQTYMQARERMHASFGNKWSHQYENESSVGVARYELREVEFLAPEQITEQRLLHDVTEFINELARPLWVWRAARGLLNAFPEHRTDGQYRSAQTRLRNATVEIDALVTKYVDCADRRLRSER
jgi:hypothetical protein